MGQLNLTRSATINGGAGNRFPFLMGELMGDTTITFTLSDVLWLCGAVCTVAAAIAVFYRAMVKAHEPEHDHVWCHTLIMCLWRQ